MDFFDPQRWRVTNTNTSKHFRSLFEEESTAVASSALTESATAHALALLSSRVEKTVKKHLRSGPGTKVTKQTGDMGDNPFTREVTHAMGGDELYERTSEIYRCAP